MKTLSNVEWRMYILEMLRSGDADFLQAACDAITHLEKTDPDVVAAVIKRGKEHFGNRWPEQLDEISEDHA